MHQQEATLVNGCKCGASKPQWPDLVSYSDSSVWLDCNKSYRTKTISIYILSQRQILDKGNLPQDSAPVCNNIDISQEMAAQSAQRNQAFRVTASDWSPVPSQLT